MYKDKDKQREAQRNWVRQKRIDKKGSTQGSTVSVAGHDTSGTIAIASPDRPKQGVIKTENAPYSKGTYCLTVEPKRGKDVKCITIDDQVKSMKTMAMLASPKRGKDIKTFKDLPTDVKMAIDMLSKNEAEHKRRTVLAINYQTSLNRHRLYGLSSGVV